MIDLHSHILRGIDDGARSLEDSLEIARAAVADGITVIAGTPHVRDDWPTDPGMMEYGVAEAADELDRVGIQLEVRRGGEIAVAWLSRLRSHRCWPVREGARGGNRCSPPRERARRRSRRERYQGGGLCVQRPPTIVATTWISGSSSSGIASGSRSSTTRS